MDNFGLRTRLVEKVPAAPSGRKWVIVIPVRQVTSLRDIVLSYMCLSMLYKV